MKCEDHHVKNPVSKKSFYGQRNAGKCTVIERAIDRWVCAFRSQPLSVPHGPQLLGDHGEWRVFHRQTEAFQYAQSRSLDLHVFAFQSESFANNSGQRKYLVTSYDLFWCQYVKMAPPSRCHYEVIPEDAACWLYFDLEFYRDFNPDRDGNKMVDIFVKFISAQLKQRYSVKCESCNVLQLDASTDKKFSRHLVFRPPYTVFDNNVSAGRFVQECISDLQVLINMNRDTAVKRSTINCDTDIECNKEDFVLKQSSTDSSFRLSNCEFQVDELETVFIRNKENVHVPFCDMAVYTRNRNFRIYLSSKLHKHNPLVIPPSSQYQAYVPLSKSHSVEKQTFLDSLISNVKYSHHLNVLTFSENTRTFNHQKIATSSLKCQRSSPNQKVTEGHATSPYPGIDAFVQSLLCKDGIHGTIRRWVFFAAGKLLSYDILRYRWCENIGRHHKSNNIVIVVDLVSGVYYQKCYDPDCRSQNFKSQDYKLPAELLPVSYDADESGFYEEISDEDLMNAASYHDACPDEVKTPAMSEMEVSDDELVTAADQVERAYYQPNHKHNLNIV